ncbi:MAG: KH domain-containing protein [Lachnospiraceae bacterium]|nr:KH domain-containing protein [Lachnospiraceae bacterium]MDY5742002.1 KH domain-containing protein [Lachnospiraceae bacterium]
MKELLEVIAKSLVDDPEAVSVTEERTQTSINLALRVSDKDIGKVIGKQGRIAKAIRTVMKAAAGMEELKVNVDILD